MKFELKITCECGENVTVPLLRTTHAHEDGRVYEDYTSISDSLEENEYFKGKVQPDGVFVICQSCKKGHELST
jgi:hypothetical protein